MTLAEAVCAPFTPPAPFRACWDFVRHVYALAYELDLPEYPGHVRGTATPDVVERDFLPQGWRAVPMAERRTGDVVWSVPENDASAIHVGLLLDRRNVAHYSDGDVRVDRLSSPALRQVRGVFRWRA